MPCYPIISSYLNSYASHFGLLPYIRFRMSVMSVEAVQPNEFNTSWKVKVKQLESGMEQEDVYDSVMVCNGHYTVPLEPNIPLIDAFKGRILHSHYYRHPEEDMFCDKVILVLGAAASGSDIGLEVSLKNLYGKHDYKLLLVLTYTI